MRKLVFIVCLLTLVVNAWAVKLPADPYYRFGEIAETEGSVLPTGVQIANNSTMGTAVYSSCYYPNGEDEQCSTCCTSIFDCEMLVDDEQIDECETNYGKCMDYCMGTSLPLDASHLLLALMIIAYACFCYVRNKRKQNQLASA
jgi:hypothetical protein